MTKDTRYILAIESSCDDTGAAVLMGDKLLANIVADQSVHEKYGGVVPELASRAHQKHIVPVVYAALEKANVSASQLDLIAYTQGPGLMGSLMVGSSFAKSFAQGLGIPAVPVDHMKGHILAHFIKDEVERDVPEFPFLSLTVSGGHTQLVAVHSPYEMELIGETIDDAAGEAYDKAAKMLSLPYPGGPLVDKHAQNGVARFEFAEPRVGPLDFSFSGVKTSILYFLRDRLKEDPDFITDNLDDLCASVQERIVSILIKKMRKATATAEFKGIGLAGGVAANSELRKRFKALGEELGLPAFIPPFGYCTDNAAMIGIVGHFSTIDQQMGLNVGPKARLPFA